MDKYVCHICRKEFKSQSGLTSHIFKLSNKENHLKPEEYYNLYHKHLGDNPTGKCLNCGKPVRFINIIKGYNKYCSYKCLANSNLVREKAKSTNLEKYGKENPLQCEEIKERIKNTNLERRGVENPFQCEDVRRKQRETLIRNYNADHNSKTKRFKDNYKRTCNNKYGKDNVSQVDEFKEKRRKTNLDRYGTENPIQLEEFKKKIRDTNLRKYGKEYIMQCKEFKEKSKKINLERYGKEYAFQVDEFKNKSEQTNLRKYGKEYASQSKEVKEKAKQTCIRKYGKENVFQVDEFKEKYKQTCMRKYGKDNPSKVSEIKNKVYDTCLKTYGNIFYPKTENFKKKIREGFYHKLTKSDRLKKLVSPLFSLEEYNGVKNYQTRYKFRCNKCNLEFEDHLMDGHIPRCPICFPSLSSNSSHYESEIYNFLSSYNITNIIQNDRSILSPLELDIYLPDYKLAIEFNGLYWHSELNGKDKHYHLNKTLSCQQKGITLLHIFEDEWVEKQEIVKSILLHKLGKTENRISARKCKIKQIDNQSAFKFLDENHLQGFINSKYHLGLFFDNEIVSISSISKPRFNKNYDWEILRFCNKMNTSVLGGFSKLLNYFKKIESGSIITYSDIRLGLDSFYEKVGFKLLNRSEPNYFYIKGFERESRLKYQKHKLENLLDIYDPILTEWENMQLNNYDRIWDCGNLVYSWK